MTEVDGCIFCKIAGGNDEKTEILHRDDTLVVFRDIRPATSHHYLVVTTEHISDAKQLKFENLGLVERMVEVGKDVVQKQGGDIIDLRMGFHWPPFHMISHLHLHVISSTSQMGFIAKGIFMERALWFAKVDWVIDRLKKMKPKDTHSNSGT
ncbi:adenosine 5'-monophosphoramidase HINT3-like isoform X2 [Mercenaria mercenaria]|uniref:adenosine 5'-monophosphoramidase HINT3-like isoform X2 n=1 Tax=Mercenaria mercenaria TaxID=6596 RepID=UPI00234E6E3D|nr:adenosine 5'-monophosphoramidase HINT3-like isoform X2 [Mercenaria mercenaria]